MTAVNIKRVFSWKSLALFTHKLWPVEKAVKAVIIYEAPTEEKGSRNVKMDEELPCSNLIIFIFFHKEVYSQACQDGPSTSTLIRESRSKECPMNLKKGEKVLFSLEKSKLTATHLGPKGNSILNVTSFWELTFKIF